MCKCVHHWSKISQNVNMSLELCANMCRSLMDPYKDLTWIRIWIHGRPAGTHLHIFPMKYLHFGRVCTRPNNNCTYFKLNINMFYLMEHFYTYFKWNIDILIEFAYTTKLFIFQMKYWHCVHIYTYFQWNIDCLM